MSLTLVSCSGGKATAKLEISRAFAVNGGQFDGGLVVHGFSSTGKKITLSIVGSYQKSFSLDADTWTFYAVGWNGPSKFAGSTYCGQSLPQNISANPTVAISVSTANCNAAFNTTVGLRDTRAIACSTFYKYTLTTDTWTEITSADPNNICTTGLSKAPLGFGTDDYNYKVVAIDHVDGVSTPVFESPCFDADGIDGAKLPNKLFPFVIKGYPTYNDCFNNTAKFQSFTFPQGLETSGPDFKHLNQMIGVNSRLVLPSSITRTGFSTFTHQIPSILCGNSGSHVECNTDITDGVDVYVPWSYSIQGPSTFERKTSLTSCPANLLNSSIKFGLVPGSCSVSDNKIKARAYVNPLVCQVSGGVNDVMDIDRVGDKIFILRNLGPNDWIDIYNDRGLLLGSISTSNDGNTLIAASNTSAGEFKIVTYRPTAPHGQTYTWDETLGPMSFGPYFLPSGVGALEADGESVIYSVGNTITVRGFNDVEITPAATYGSLGIFELKVLDGRLYFLDNGTIKFKDWVQPGTITGSGGTLSGTASTFSVTTSPEPLIYAVSGSNQLLALRPNNTLFNSTGTTYVGVTGIEVTERNVFRLNGTILSVKDKASDTIISSTSGMCSDTITVDGAPLMFKSAIMEHFNLHDNSMRLIGRKYSSNRKNIVNAFSSLSDDHDNNISSGGTLRRVQEHLSAKGLSGVFPQFASCNALKTSALLPMTSGKSIYDPEENKNFNVVYTISLSTTNLPLFTCVDTDPTGAGCVASTYDLDINFSVSKDGITDERGRIQLSCGSRKGTFESLEVEGSEISRELIVWNTQDQAYARVEAFNYDYESPTNLRASITKIVKDTNDLLFARQVFAGQNGSNFHAGAVEIQRDLSDLMYKSSQLNPPSWSSSDFTSSPGIDSDFATMTADSSIGIGANSVFAPHTSASFGASSRTSQTSLEAPGSLPMSMAAFENLDLPGNDVLLFFTLTP